MLDGISVPLNSLPIPLSPRLLFLLHESESLYLPTMEARIPQVEVVHWRLYWGTPLQPPADQAFDRSIFRCTHLCTYGPDRAARCRRVVTMLLGFS